MTTRVAPGRVPLRIAALLLALVLLLLAIWLVVVRERTGQWGLRPAATPVRLDFHSRHYTRGGREEIPPTGVRIGSSWGGGEVWGAAGRRTPAVLWVRDGSTSYAYGLVGGP
jgi:hypothetical protein